jgi:uncharacterized protein YecT (DUF1311 family)
MKLRFPLSLLAALTLAVTNASAQAAGTLRACMRDHAESAQARACVIRAQSQWNDEMLAAFMVAQQTVRELDQAAGVEVMGAALTESQRDFERYVQGQCTFVHALFARAGIAQLAALACEADLLQQRTAVLRSFARVETKD